MASAADIKKMAGMVTEEDLQDLQNFLRELEGRCDQAQEDGRIYMSQQYIRLIAIINPEEKRIRERFKREKLSGQRKRNEELKVNARNGRESEA